jgi:hypothetical protein
MVHRRGASHSNGPSSCRDRHPGRAGPGSSSPEHGRAPGGQLLVGRLRRGLDEAGEHDRGRDPLGTGPHSWVAMRPPWENPTAATFASGSGERRSTARRRRWRGPGPGRRARRAGTMRSRREPPRAGRAALPRAGPVRASARAGRDPARSLHSREIRPAPPARPASSPRTPRRAARSAALPSMAISPALSMTRAHLRRPGRPGGGLVSLPAGASRPAAGASLG